MTRVTKINGGRKRGSALVEFALAGSFIFLPMLAGLTSVGVSMVNAMQVASVNASAGQMLSTGVDFTQAANQALVQNLGVASNLDFSSSGKGVVILSEIDGTSSGNVCSQQFIIGNSAQGTSKYVSGGVGSASGFTLMGTLSTGQIVYLAETYYDNSQNAWAFAPPGTPTTIYVKAVF